MIDRLEVYWRLWRRRISRSEWVVRLLRLPVSEGTENDPGLVLIQIDGLARHQFERAMREGRMPFLRKLIRRQNYRLHTFYSGLPSSTPAVQAEVFYGVRCAVPAFSYFDRRCKRIFRMFNCEDAIEIEQRIAEKGTPLLKGGSSYSNVYTGGAEEAHFCATTLGWSGFWTKGSPLALPLILLLNFNMFLRTIGLSIVEFVLAFVDFVRGVNMGESFLKELKFIPARIGISVIARELGVIGASIDVARGLPIIHINFLGYDEHSHRRGPSSEFAHWGLKGIDGAIRRIWNAAQRSQRRHYDVWVFSDHGQEDTVSYVRLTGRTLSEAVAKIHDESAEFVADRNARADSEQLGRVRSLRWRGRRQPPESLPVTIIEGAEHPVVTAMGPLALVYWPSAIDDDAEKEAIARRFIEDAQVPIVMTRTSDDRIVAWNRKGRWSLPEDIAQVIGAHHPMLDDVAEDLMCLVRHENAGVFVLSGWRYDDDPISFPDENGSHAGPGYNETQGFALLPADAPIPVSDRPYLRPLMLHQAGMMLLGRIEPEERMQLLRQDRGRDVLRIMTYNVHSCRGMDGRISPRRIARIIALYDPDIVCLQELDVGRLRTRGEDQAQLIASRLKMDHHFHPAIRLEEEAYGDAILSRYPMRLRRAESLPGTEDNPRREPRGALWTTVQYRGVGIQVINTHFGLNMNERQQQVRALLSERWLGDPECTGPVVLCGDFNAMPHSAVWRALGRCLHDAQLQLENHRPRKTWFGRMPVGRIDHVFISDHFEVAAVQVASTALTRTASDHLPLIVDLKLKSSVQEGHATAADGGLAAVERQQDGLLSGSESTR